MIEEWKDVIGYVGLYQISSLGRVRSLERQVKHWRAASRTVPQRILAPAYVSGYPKVTLYKRGAATAAPIHRMVAEAFVPNPDKKPQVNHLDGNKANPSASNLEWVTPLENVRHAHRTGLANFRGEASTSSVLTERQVRAIRRRLSKDETCVAIARDYPVAKSTIARIKRRVIWSHI